MDNKWSLVLYTGGWAYKAENITLEKAAIVTEIAKRTYDIPDHQETRTHAHAVYCYAFCHNADIGKTQTIKHRGKSCGFREECKNCFTD